MRHGYCDLALTRVFTQSESRKAEGVEALSESAAFPLDKRGPLPVFFGEANET